MDHPLALSLPGASILLQLMCRADEVVRMIFPARTIFELNIKHYRELLKSETDAAKRQTITGLLAEEEAKLARLLAKKDGER
jgi:hypothetical protein